MPSAVRVRVKVDANSNENGASYAAAASAAAAAAPLAPTKTKKYTHRRICSIEGCTTFARTPANSEALCTKHNPNRRLCAIEGCTTPARAQADAEGLCTKHKTMSRALKRKRCPEEGCTNMSMMHRLHLQHSGVGVRVTRTRSGPSSNQGRLCKSSAKQEQDGLPSTLNNLDQKPASNASQKSVTVAPSSAKPIPDSSLTLTENDIICCGPWSNGSSYNHLEGNKKFLAVLRELHLMAQTMHKNLDCAREVVLLIRSRGGRFLNKDDESLNGGRLYEVRDIEAERKVLWELNRVQLELAASRHGAVETNTAANANTNTNTDYSNKSAAQECSRGIHGGFDVGNAVVNKERSLKSLAMPSDATNDDARRVGESSKRDSNTGCIIDAENKHIGGADNNGDAEEGNGGKADTEKVGKSDSNSVDGGNTQNSDEVGNVQFRREELKALFDEQLPTLRNSAKTAAGIAGLQTVTDIINEVKSPADASMTNNDSLSLAATSKLARSFVKKYGKSPKKVSKRAIDGNAEKMGETGLHLQLLKQRAAFLEASYQDVDSSFHVAVKSNEPCSAKHLVQQAFSIEAELKQVREQIGHHVTRMEEQSVNEGDSAGWDEDGYSDEDSDSASCDEDGDSDVECANEPLARDNGLFAYKYPGFQNMAEGNVKTREV